MYQFINIPHERDRVRMESRVSDSHARIVLVHPDRDEPYNTTRVWDGFVGDHMFAENKRDDLRKMFADAVRLAIVAGRDIGYKQAMADVRNLIGAKG